MMAKFVCIVCEQNNWLVLWKHFLKCKYCGLVRSADKYFHLDPQRLYDKKYFEGTDYFSYKAEEKALSKNFEERIRKIQHHKSHGNLLDIGCAYGYFLKTAASKGFHCEGLEVNKNIAGIARQKGFTVKSGELINLKYKHSQYDLITMFDVIEHLVTPNLYLNKVSQLLRPGAITAIETGNIDALAPKVRGHKWRLMVPNIHLYYFSPNTITLLLRKYGLEPIEIQTVGFYRSLKQIFFRFFKNNRFPELLRALFETPIYLNTYDLMFIIAKKKK